MYSKLCRNFPVLHPGPLQIQSESGTKQLPLLQIPHANCWDFSPLVDTTKLCWPKPQDSNQFLPPSGSPRSRPLVHPALLCNIALSNVYVNMYIDLSIFTAFPLLCMSRTGRRVTNQNQVCFRYAIKFDSVCKSLHLSEQPLCCNMFKAFFPHYHRFSCVDNVIFMSFGQSSKNL